MNVGEGLTDASLDPVIVAAFLAEPPGWTRLEAQSVSGDPTPGLEARVHDPLWLLARQWQLGEFEAEDVGSPTFVTVSYRVGAVNAFQPGDSTEDQPVVGWLADEQIEPVAEREPTPAHGCGLRWRAEAGSQLLAELREAAVDASAISRLLDACAIQTPDGTWTDPFDTAEPVLAVVLAGRVPDGEAAAEVIESGLALSPPQLPEWFGGVADPQPILDALAHWLDWYRGEVAPRRDRSRGSWIDDRLEYRFSLGVAGPSGQRVLRAPQFAGGRVEWCDFDHDGGAAALTPPGGADSSVASRTSTAWATPLRFGGMPADRYWEFEDALVDLGALQVQPHDIARLALVEFAMVYSNDWLAIPVDVPYGSFVTIEDVTYKTTFGEEIVVPRSEDVARRGRFRLFELSEVGSDDSLPGLFVPPAAPVVFEGPALEEVLYLRDEAANMGWGVERVIQGPSGDPRSRLGEPRPTPFQPGTDVGADMDYWLENEVPAWWIPLLPVSSGYASIELRKGAMLKDGEPMQPLGVLLRPHEALTLQNEEVPREGVRVRRVPVLARRADGTYARWITRRVDVGRGEGASGLAFDSAVRRTPS